MKEDLFINLIKETLPSSAFYIGDDTAYISEKDLILTQDTLIEDVHFRKSTISPFDLGIKSIAVNLSDIAVTGGIAKYVLISLSMPENIDKSFIKEFYQGVNKICSEYGVLVVGGDLTKAEKVTVSVAVVGEMKGYKPARRSLAKPGNVVITTGEYGSSRAGLWLLENGIKKPEYEKFVKAHINPVPQLKTGREIIKSCKTTPAMMDTSDGLADALYKISFASGVSMEISYDNIPHNKDLSIISGMAGTEISDWIFYGGEDYQLIATVDPACFNEISAIVPDIKKIGMVVSSGNNPHIIVNYNNRSFEINSDTIDNKGFSHFNV